MRGKTFDVIVIQMYAPIAYKKYYEEVGVEGLREC